MAFMLSPLLKRYTWNSAWLYYARIFIALCGTTAFPWWLGDVKLTIPLTLGMVAAALTDLDDRLAGRLRNLIITLFCFFIASASVELLFPWPWLFAIGLTLSTSGFILLGGLGQRYATIAFGALLIAIYTMLGTSLYEHWYQQPMYLLAGAVWYNVLTLIGHLLFPVRPLQDNLARCYEQLARYLELKSRMFDTEYEKSWHAREYPARQSNNAACDAFPVDHDRHVSGSAARVSSDSMSPSADRWREPNRTAVPGFHLQYQDQTCVT
ncbi:hypothetical protein AWG50_19920 [Escherichia coli]|nr:hypothetical protein AWF02_08330 [Escherichia coli]KZH95909.1 hypothetical protein AWG50_19920 [Escherichia coli]